MVLAPVLTDVCFHTIIGEKKTPRSKLRGGLCLARRRIRKFEEPESDSLNLYVESRARSRWKGREISVWMRWLAEL